MRTMKSVSAVRKDAAKAAAESVGEAAEEPSCSETYESYRVGCPDCGQPIALLDLDEKLPEHARCASPWNPFGLTVCQGSGRPVTDAVPTHGEPARERGVGELLTLPEGLDWRTQPFSHVGGPGSRPLRVGAQR